jgi:hypothetical protein
MHLRTPLAAMALLALAACASGVPDTPTTLSVVNSLSYEHAVSGKRDGLRSAWPAATLGGTSEQFPMAQVKQCDAAGTTCSWGVLKAQRTFGKVKEVPQGVAVDVEVVVELDRSLHTRDKGLDATLTIPADVAALKGRLVETRSVVLAYGTVTRIDFKYGISYEMCALRLDAARQPLDKCEIAYF